MGVGLRINISTGKEYERQNTNDKHETIGPMIFQDASSMTEPLQVQSVR